MARFLNRLKEKLDLAEADISQSDATIQQSLAPRLRKKAIEHLANGQGVVSRSFRGEYLASGHGNYQPFLVKQAQQGTWGTYIEATALGELLDCNVVVTPVKKGVEQAPFCLYRAADDQAPTVHLFNSNNTHWYVKSSTPTLGNGDCLYNAFAQALKMEAAPELRFTEKPSSPHANVQQRFLSSKPTVIADNAAIKLQRDIETAIAVHPTPANLESELRQEKIRINHLPAKEQQQIADDHHFALKLAYEEMGYARRNVVCRSYDAKDIQQASIRVC
jgi:hypothetical protein